MLLAALIKESMRFGVCVQAYVCEKLQEQGEPDETLNEIELRLGKDEVRGLTEEGKRTCLM